MPASRSTGNPLLEAANGPGLSQGHVFVRYSNAKIRFQSFFMPMIIQFSRAQGEVGWAGSSLPVALGRSARINRKAGGFECRPPRL
jgi:hypothetical protein